MAFSPWKRNFLVAAAAACVALPLAAQQPNYSSSSTRDLLGGEDIDGVSLSAAPAPQYGGGYGGYSGYHESRWSHVAIEAGGGFTAPIGNDVNGGFTTAIGNVGTNYGAVTWGGNILVGAGWNFSKRFAVMGEYQYNDIKIPGNTLSAVYNSDAGYYAANSIYALGGNVHLHAINAEPVFYYSNSDKHSYAGYILGGVGFYHQTVNFTAPVEEESFYGIYVANADIASYSSNAFGLNFGTGVSYKTFGPDSHAKLFAEVRYIWADTPTESASDLNNGNVLHIGTEELLPVTVGIRF